jgi:hypothetical protein
MLTMFLKNVMSDCGKYAGGLLSIQVVEQLD